MLAIRAGRKQATMRLASRATAAAASRASSRLPVSCNLSTRAHSSSSSSSSSSSARRLPRSLLAAAAMASALAAGASFTTLLAAESSGDRKGAAVGGGSKGPSPHWLSDRICAAAGAGDLSALQSLFATHQPSEGVNITHRYGWTPLHTAVAHNRVDVVEWLLSQPGVDLSRTDRYTPRARNLEEMIDKQRARQAAFPSLWPNQSANGMSALHYAALHAHEDIVRLLLAAGADPDQTTSSGERAESVVDWSAVRESAEGEPSDAHTRELQEKKRRAGVIADLLTEERRRRAEARERAQKEERLRFPLELKLKKDMVGQEVPILSVSAAIRRKENGWFDQNKPLVMLFLGSSGVGKTMLAKLLAQHVVKDTDDGFVRLDMSEYQSKHEMARLIGSPPGYVGYEEGGQLTTKLSKCPNAIVLLDEIEKCHPDVLALLLQVFDEGRLTDGKGNTIHCPQATFVMTSNLVQDEIRDAIESGYALRPPEGQSLLTDVVETSRAWREAGGVTTVPMPASADEVRRESERRAKEGEQRKNGSADKAALDEQAPSPSTDGREPLVGGIPIPPTSQTILPGSLPVPPSSSFSKSSAKPAQQLAKLATDTEHFLRYVVHPILKRAFRRDEFIGRINDIIIFHPFSHSDLQQTVSMELSRWASRARERHGIDLLWTPALVDSLTLNYDERYGYRSVIFGVEKRVINVLASAHERDRIKSGDRVLLDVDEASEPGAQPPVVIRQVTPKDDKDKDESGGGRKKFLGLF